VSQANCEDTGYTTGKTFYGYDGEGRRVTKTDSFGTMVFVYDALGRLAAEYGGTVDTAATRYLTTDHLGSTRVITDASRTVVECKDYLPFGDEIVASSQNGRNGISCYGADLARQKFTGYERDSESRLDFAQARYYSWAAGRFNFPNFP
jgi:YD repeat-containing protein